MSLTILLWEKTYFESFKNFDHFFANKFFKQIK